LLGLTGFHVVEKHMQNTEPSPEELFLGGYI